MSNAKPKLIIAGLPDIAEMVMQTGIFPDVSAAGGVRQLLSMFSQLGQKVRPSDVVFIFADNLNEDAPNMPLVEVVRRLTGAGFNLLVVSVTARGAELGRQFPRVGLLPTPVQVNDLLYAISTFGYQIEPVGEIATPTTATPTAAATTTNPGGSWGRPAEVGPAERATTTPSAQAPGKGWGAAGGVTPGVTERSSDPASPVQHGSGFGRPAGVPGQAGPGPTERVVYPGEQPRGPYTEQSVAPQNYGNTNARPALFGGVASPTRPDAATTGSWEDTAPPRDGTPWTGGPVQRAGAYPSTPAMVGRRGYVITVAVAKGGVGKSSLSLNLAVFLGMKLRGMGKTVCIIDANVQQGDIGKYLDEFKPNINTIVQNPAWMTRERILEGLLHRPEYGISALLGPAVPDEGNPLNINSMLYNEVLDLLKYHYDYIIIDTPVAEKHHELFSNFALPRADYVVVPVTPSYQTLHNADNWLKSAVTQPRHAGGAGLDPSQVGVVLNREEGGIGCDPEDVQRTMPRWRFLGSIPEHKAWKLANNNNELVALKNYVEINEAFSMILYGATGEAALLPQHQEPDSPGGLAGILDRFRRRRQ